MPDGLLETVAADGRRRRPVDSRIPAREIAHSTTGLLDALPVPVLSSAAQVAPAELRDRAAGSPTASRVSLPRGQARTGCGAEVGGERVAGRGGSAAGHRRRATTPHLAVAGHQAGARSGSLGFLVELRASRSASSASRRGRSATSASASASAGRSLFWTWLIVVAGQFLVALGFAELASHFPVAGSHLPVVEAPVAPDARLVHRLVLLLGAGRDGDRPSPCIVAFVVDDEATALTVTTCAQK